jgi:TonB family protein
MSAFLTPDKNTVEASMRRFSLISLLFLCRLAPAQETITVDAISAMHVCSDKNPASAGPCASAPKPISKSAPTYPEKARQARKVGTVILGLTIGKDGATHDLHVVSGPDDDLNQAAIAAVTHWTFEPGTYQGSPVAVEIAVEVNFRLEQNIAPSPEKPLTATPNPSDTRNLLSDADEAYKHHDYQTAVTLARRITSLNPQHFSAWNLLGISLLDLNQPDAAAAALETQIKIDPASRFAYNNLGHVYWRQRKYDDAASQFRKQLVINPEDHYAHANLGMMLREQKKCSEAMPELEKAVSLSPGHAEALLAEGGCDLDLGNRAKGLSELEQATSTSSAPGVWNGAAYTLAKRNIELDRAEKWSDTSLSIESVRLRSVSLEHLTPELLNYVFWTAHYWDTRGYIYFLRGDNAKAESYIAAAWGLLPLPAMGNHLAEIYEKTGQTNRAIRTYAMAIAAADRPSRASVDPDDLTDARKSLTNLAGAHADIPALIERGGADLTAASEVLIPNPSKISGTAEFSLRLSDPEKLLETRQLSGDKSLSTLAASLQASQLPIKIPGSASVEIPLRGTLHCESRQPCRLSLLTSEAAVDLARKEEAPALTSATADAATDPHIYDSPSMGIHLSLPDEWKMIKDEPGTFSRPHNVMFNKPGSVAYFMLTREHMEGSGDLYRKMLDSYFSKRADFKRTEDQPVTLDGLTGTRWSVSWTESGGVSYVSVMEFFTIGDDHYRLTSVAPREVYDRYSESFENILRSVKFPMLHTDPRMLDDVK